MSDVGESVVSREWRLSRYCSGSPQISDVDLVTVTLGEPAPGLVRVRNEVMSVEPYMRGRMSGLRTYADPYVLGDAMSGPAVGVVTASQDEGIPLGCRVVHDFGWREHAMVPAAQCRVVPGTTETTPSHYLGPLGIPGMTAWVGLEQIARARSGDVVFVSSAAGAVGSVAVQLAKRLNCTVIGSAGSAEKCEAVRKLGADAVFDYHDGSVTARLRDALAEVGADGLDVYFDNVGGDHLESAIRLLNDHARIALCGMISTYNATGSTPGPSNLLKLIWRRARMEGFLLRDHLDRRAEFESAMIPLLASGQLRSLEYEVSGGIDAAWRAYTDMLDGRAFGKVVVPL